MTLFAIDYRCQHGAFCMLIECGCSSSVMISSPNTPLAKPKLPCKIYASDGFLGSALIWEGVCVCQERRLTDCKIGAKGNRRGNLTKSESTLSGILEMPVSL